MFGDLIKENKFKKYLIYILVAIVGGTIALVKIKFEKKIVDLDNLLTESIELIKVKKDYKNAMIKLESVLQETPTDTDSINGIGYCHFMLGEFVDAAEFLEEARSFYPDETWYVDYLIDSFTAVGTNESLMKVDVLLNKYKEHYKYLHQVVGKLKTLHKERLVWYFFKKKEYSQALKLFEEVVPEYYELFKTDLDEFDECFSPVHYHFAMIYKHKSEMDKAKEEFEKAVKSGGPQNVFAHRSKKELGKINE